jgi:hypothetical protein
MMEQQHTTVTLEETANQELPAYLRGALLPVSRLALRLA